MLKEIQLFLDKFSIDAEEDEKREDLSDNERMSKHKSEARKIDEQETFQDA